MIKTISMKQFNKIYSGVIVAIILLATSPMLLGLIWPRINDVRTGETPEYPDIQPQILRGTNTGAAFDAVLRTAESMGWEIREADRDRGIIEAVATVPFFRFRDDVTITITADGSSAVVNMRSRSRVGKSDLGENARRIRRFQAALTAQLARPGEVR